MLRPHRGDEPDVAGSSITDLPEGSRHEPITVPSSSESPSSSSSEDPEDGDNRLTGDTSNQLVLYDPNSNGAQEVEPLQSRHPSKPRFFSPSKTLPSIGAFTVQCAKCFKWRLIPSKQKYEEIRERILETPFFCETVREWRPDVSCDDPTDLSQDGSRLWAIDKPNIAQPPPGWQRLLRIRGEGSTKFADVYYVAPSGKKLRSMVEIQKYLMDHPEFIRDGVTLSQFSFQIPRPLQENYVRKRPVRVMASRGNTKVPEATEASPLAWAAPDDDLTELQLGRPVEPGLEPSHDDPPAKRPRISQPLTTDFNGYTVDDDQPKIELDQARQSSDGS